jgi:hypothetical protein
MTLSVVSPVSVDKGNRNLDNRWNITKMEDRSTLAITSPSAASQVSRKLAWNRTPTSALRSRLLIIWSVTPRKEGLGLCTCFCLFQASNTSRSLQFTKTFFTHIVVGTHVEDSKQIRSLLLVYTPYHVSRFLEIFSLYLKTTHANYQQFCLCAFTLYKLSNKMFTVKLAIPGFFFLWKRGGGGMLFCFTHSKP